MEPHKKKSLSTHYWLTAGLSDDSWFAVTVLVSMWGAASLLSALLSSAFSRFSIRVSSMVVAAAAVPAELSGTKAKKKTNVVNWLKISQSVVKHESL